MPSARCHRSTTCRCWVHASTRRSRRAPSAVQFQRRPCRAPQGARVTLELRQPREYLRMVTAAVRTVASTDTATSAPGRRRLTQQAIHWRRRQMIAGTPEAAVMPAEVPSSVLHPCDGDVCPLSRSRSVSITGLRSRRSPLRVTEVSSMTATSTPRSTRLVTRERGAAGGRPRSTTAPHHFLLVTLRRRGAVLGRTDRH